MILMQVAEINEEAIHDISRKQIRIP